MYRTQDILICPICGAPLERENRSLVCLDGVKRHNYDVSKEGYVNLLPPGKGKNSHTGDDADMVRARREFLSTGAYAPLSDEIAALICKNTVSEELLVVDSGCGEGYHTCRYTKALASMGKRGVCAAFDASKHAAAAGAKGAVRASLAPRGGIGAPFDGSCQVMFMTGNIFSLPVRAGCADAVVSMFAPIAWEENRRMLKDGGILVVAASGEDHLLEMRQVIYDEVIKKSPVIPAGEGFCEIHRTSLRYTAELSSSDEIMNLFGMTPFCYKTSAEATEKLRSLDKLTVTVNTEFFIFRKLQ